MKKIKIKPNIWPYEIRPNDRASARSTVIFDTENFKFFSF